MPLLASFKLTYRCNLQCSGCPFHLKAHTRNDHMNWETACASLRTLKRAGCRIVVFEGGEPCLWQDGGYTLKDLAHYAQQHFSCVAVTTNGTYPLDVPVDIIWVSIDGTKETHNCLRSNSFDRIHTNLRAASHPKILVHVTVNRRNWRELERIAAYVRDLPTVHGMTVQFFYPYRQGEASLSLSPGERSAAINSIIRLKQHGYPILNSTRCLHAMRDNTWTCHDDILINVDPDGMITTGCYVKNRGDVRCHECGFTPIAEASAALDLLPSALRAGWRIFVNS